METPRMSDDNYDDIINMEYLEPKNRPRMTMHQQAVQFSQFAALTGHGAAVEEAHRITDRKKNWMTMRKQI